jgi:hypothetical protein
VKSAIQGIEGTQCSESLPRELQIEKVVLLYPEFSFVYSGNIYK